MNHLDRHNVAQITTNNADSDSTSTTSIEFSDQVEARSSCNYRALPPQERAEKTLASIMKHQSLKDQIDRFTGHHSVSSLDIYIDAAIRAEK
jgi:hypothetical protein